MTATLATTKVSSASSDVKREMTLMVPAADNGLPPGFTEPANRPIVFIGGEVEGGQPFYQWNHDENCREYVPANRFSATLLEMKTIVKNADDPIKKSVKLVAEFQTAAGNRVAMQCGANTYAALGMVAGLSNLTPEQLQKEIGLSGKVGRSGKVTFVSVFADGALQRNPDAEEMLKEAKADGAIVQAIEGYIGDINAKIKVEF